MSPIDLSSELPPPRDDEPSSLRQDIFDELADHLECSLHREQVKTADEAVAQRRVLERFGNPASIARKLWLDAMWEKIVMQRVTSTAMTLAALVAVFLCAALWRSVTASQEFQAQQLAQQREMLEALRSRLSGAEGKSASAPMDGWEPVVVVLKGEDGQPTTGRITLYNGDARVLADGQFYDRSLEKPLEISPVESRPGRYDLGLLPHGKYKLLVALETSGASMMQEVFVRAGASTFEFTCPTIVPPVTQVSVELLPPDDLRDAPLKYDVRVFRDRVATLGGARWSLGSREKTRYLVFNPDGQLAGELDDLEIRSAGTGGATPWTMAMLRPPAPIEFHARQVHVMVYMSILMEKAQLLRIPGYTRAESLPEGDLLQVPSWIFEVVGKESESILMRFTPGEDGRTVIRFPQDHPLWTFVRERLSAPTPFGVQGHFNEQGVFVPDSPGTSPSPVPNQ